MSQHFTHLSELLCGSGGVNELKEYVDGIPLHNGVFQSKVEVLSLAQGTNSSNQRPGPDRVLGGELLLFACRAGKLDVVQCLVQEYQVNPDYDAGDTHPLAAACEGPSSSNVAVLKYLLATCQLNPNKPLVSTKLCKRFALHHAVAAPNAVELIRCFLQEGKADVNIAAAADGYTAAHHAAILGKVDVLQTLFQEGHAGVDAKSKTGRTPCHFAATYGHTATVKYLVEEAHCLLAVPDVYGRTPFQLAVMEGHLLTVQYLLAHPVVLKEALALPSQRLASPQTFGSPCRRRGMQSAVQQLVQSTVARTCKHVFLLSLTPSPPEFADSDTANIPVKRSFFESDMYEPHLVSLICKFV